MFSMSHSELLKEIGSFLGKYTSLKNEIIGNENNHKKEVKNIEENKKIKIEQLQNKITSQRDNIRIVYDNKNAEIEKRYYDQNSIIEEDLNKVNQLRKENISKANDAKSNFFVSKSTIKQYNNIVEQCDSLIEKRKNEKYEIAKKRQESLSNNKLDYDKKINESREYEEKELSAIQHEYLKNIEDSKNNYKRKSDGFVEYFFGLYETEYLKKFNNIKDLAKSVVPDFERYDVPDVMPEFITLGTLEIPLLTDNNYELNQMLNKISRHDSNNIIPYNMDYRLNVPYCQSLLDGVSMMINYSTMDKNIILDIVQPLMVYIMAYFPARKIEFTLIDPLNAGSSFSELKRVASYGNEKIIDQRIWTAESDIESAIKRLSDFVVDMNSNYGEKNLDKRLTEEPYKIIVITDFPHALTQRALSDLTTIVRNSKKAGIGVFIFSNNEEILKLNNDNSAIVRELSDDINVLKYENGVYFLSNKNNYEMVFSFKYLDVVRAKQEELISIIRRRIEHTESSIKRISDLYDYNLLDSTNWFTGIDDKLEIPVGFAGSDNIVKLYFGDGTFQHLLVGGSTQSGKTHLLHTIIMGILLNYSPEAVSILLIDFKEGVEFHSYLDYTLPTIDDIQLDTKRDRALEILKDLENEFRDRAHKFKEQRVSTINQYNEKSNYRLPRKIIIFDELELLFDISDNISDECKRIFNELFDQGGALGIQFVLSTQNFSNCAGLNLQQFKGRLILSGAQGILVDHSDIVSNLGDKSKGYFYYNQNYGKGTCDLIRYPDVSPAQDDETINILYKMSEYFESFKSEGIYEEKNIFTANLESDPKFIINRFIKEGIKDKFDELMENITLLLGYDTDNREMLLTDFKDKFGENLLVLSPKEEEISYLFSTISISLMYEAVVRNNLDNTQELLFVIDLFTRRRRNSRSSLMDIFSKINNNQEFYNNTTEGVEDIFDKVINIIEKRKSGSNNNYNQVFFMIFGLHKIKKLGSYDETGLYEKIISVLTNGPEYGIHSIVWTDSYARINEIFAGDRFQRLFKQNILYKISDEELSEFGLDIDEDYASMEMAVYHDWNLSLQNNFRLYGSISDDWVEEFLMSLKL